MNNFWKVTYSNFLFKNSKSKRLEPIQIENCEKVTYKLLWTICNGLWMTILYVAPTNNRKMKKYGEACFSAQLCRPQENSLEKQFGIFLKPKNIKKVVSHSKENWSKFSVFRFYMNKLRELVRIKFYWEKID